MKILGVSFGTKNGNNDAVCKEALKGALAKGAEIEFINMQNLHIEHCTGCTACVMSLMSGRGGGCVINDDFEWFRSKMLDADGIVFVTPIFEDGTTGLFHTITDRLGPRFDRAMNIIGTKIAEDNHLTPPDIRVLKDKVVSFIAVGGSDWFERVQSEMFTMSMMAAWKVINNEVFQWSKCIAMEDEKLAVAYTVGENIAEAAADYEAAEYKSEPGICPHCHSRNFYLADEADQAICCQCGLKGTVAVVDGKVSFTFPPESESLAHNTVSGKFKHADDIQENEGKLMELKKTPEYKARMQEYKDFISSTMPPRE
jgi:multimeric flavodoxin WrbA